MQVVWNISLDSSGYSSCGRNYILALDSINQDVKLDQTIVSQNLNGYGVNKTEKDKFEELSKKSYSKKYVRIHHCVPDRFYIDDNAFLNIGYTVNETYDIPKRWAYMCNKMDAIFTASTFCKEVFEKNGVNVPIFVVPHCLNKEIYNREVNPLFFKNNRYKNKFLFSGDVTDRKGIFELLEVWDSIPNNYNSSLTIKGYYNSFSRQDQNKLKNKIKEHLKDKKRNPVFFYGHCLDTSIVPNFVKSFDYVVSPSKGEGFGLVPFEAIFLGVPPIVTNATGILEYANEKNSIFINCENHKEASEDLYRVNPDYKNSLFIEINKENLKEIINNIMQEKTSFSINGETYNEFVNRFSYEPIANLIINNIGELT